MKDKLREHFVNKTMEGIVEVACIVDDIEKSLEDAYQEAKTTNPSISYSKVKTIARELSDRLQKEYGDKAIKHYRDDFHPKQKQEKESEE